MTRQVLRKGTAVLALAVAFGLFTATRADAAFFALICNDAACDNVGTPGDLIIQDNAAGDSLPALGAMNIATSMGGLTVLVNTSQSKPILGSATAPQMDLTYTVTGIGQVWLYASDDNFGPTGIVTLQGNVDGNFTGTATHTAILAGGNDNTQFLGPGNQNLDLSSVVTASDNVPPDVDINLSKAFGAVSPYFITIGIGINRTTAGTSTGDYSLVPEPASLALFGFGLIGLARARRRARR